MSAFLLYIVRGGFYLGLFYAFFLLVMRRTKFYRLNRILLLAGSYLCLLLPALRLRTAPAAAVSAGDLAVIATGVEPAAQAAPSVFPWNEVLLALYIAGALVTLVLYLVSVVKMARLMRVGRTEERCGCRLMLLEADIPSFSWGRTVVMGRRDLEENPVIFTHELMHVRCGHTRDLVLLLPVQLLFWWNPLVWITREELRLLHEYEADEGVIRSGIDAARYQLLLVRKAVGEHRFVLASEFQHLQVKNRVEMMLKPASSRWWRWSYLVIVPVLGVFMFFCNPARATVLPAADEARDLAGPEPEAEPDRPAFTIRGFGRMPSFDGGDTGAFAQWVVEQLRDVRQSVRGTVEGEVLVQFVVGGDGAVRDVQVMSGLRPDLDEAVVRAVSAAPRWEPGYNSSGEPVSVTFAIPVSF
jgi:TonB family protein